MDLNPQYLVEQKGAAQVEYDIIGSKFFPLICMRLHSPIPAPKRTIITILIGRAEVNNSTLQSLATEPCSDFPDLFLFGLWVSLVLCLSQHSGSLCSI